MTCSITSRAKAVATFLAAAAIAAGCSTSAGTSADNGATTAPRSGAGINTGTTRDPNTLGLEAVSTRPEYVTGGDVTVAISPPAGSTADPGTASFTANGKPATVTPVTTDRRGRHVATISGLADGKNEIAATLGGTTASLTITNHPTTGPLFSGPALPLPVCSTEQYGLGPATDANCSAPAKTTWRYKSTDGTTKPLDDPTAKPADLATIAEGPNKGKPFIVREEAGVLNRSIYWIDVLDPSPKRASASEPSWDDSAWNGRLVYQFGGGCGTTYTQGFLLLGRAPENLLTLGYATATATFNTYQVMCNDVLSAETALMVKEHFSESYGPPVHTIGNGGSGGAIQQYLIAYNYPGILDAVGALLPFPDAFSIAPGVVDCVLLNNYYRSDAGKGLTTEQRAAINGQISTQTCDFWESTFAQNIKPDAGCSLDILAAAGDTVKGLPGSGGGLPKLPAEQRYDPQTNRSGLRCTMQDGMINQIGKDPATGFARRPLDNTGVQYGLAALNAGAITPDQFLDLNEKVGGTDVDGRPTTARMKATAEDIAPVYATGRVIEGGGPLDTIPIITVNVYTDELGDIHDRFRAFSIRDRLTRPDGGTPANSMIWTRGVPKGQTLIDALTGTIDVGSELVTTLDDWLDAMDKDTGTTDVATKLERDRPANAVDNCLSDTGERISGLDVYTKPGPCRDDYPIHGDPRTAAGAPRRNDIGKCQLQPSSAAFGGSGALVTVPFTDAQKSRYAAIFADGVCDWSKPGVGQVPTKGPWQDFGR